MQSCPAAKQGYLKSRAESIWQIRKNYDKNIKEKTFCFGNYSKGATEQQGSSASATI